MTIKRLSDESKLASAANSAVEAIASAAADATRVIANAAAEATKVVNMKSSVDHDLLIELKTRMDGIKEDIKSLADGTKAQIADHESRITAIETKGNKQAVMITVIIALGFIATSLLLYHVFGAKII